MKKLFHFLAIGAIVLGMASCNEDVNLKNFKIEVTEIGSQNAAVSITPATAETRYLVAIEFKNTFMRYKSNKEIPLELLNNFLLDPLTGPQESPILNLLPATEYVYYVAEVDEKGNIIGELEYVSFKTKSVEVLTPPTEEGSVNPLEKMTGQVVVYKEDGIVFLSVAWINEVDKIQNQMQLQFFSDSPVGHFKTNDLARFLYSFVPYIRTEDKISTDRGEIYDLDVTGKYDEKEDLYVYTGWVTVLYPEGDMAFKAPMRVTAQLVEK